MTAKLDYFHVSKKYKNITTRKGKYSLGIGLFIGIHKCLFRLVVFSIGNGYDVIFCLQIYNFHIELAKDNDK